MDAGPTCPDGTPRNTGRCASDDDCCERESCFLATGICFARDACDETRPCPQAEQICRDADGDGFNECVFERCDENDPNACDGLIQCPPDKVVACVAGGCTCGEPCQGGCPPSQGCCIPTDMCMDLPPECAGLTCPLGQFVSVTSSGAWSTNDCMVAGQVCECELLPPLALGDIGLHSALAHDGRSGVMSAYNLDYGDLMFGVVSVDGSTVAWEFVDGVPTTSVSITGRLDGPRGGNSAPGDDVGLYTDIAGGGVGAIHISYFDRDRGALKYARFESGTGWRVHTIDGEAPGDTGLYTSLTLDGSGRPRIAYLAARVLAAGARRESVLVLAFANSAAPTDASAWTKRTIDAIDLSAFPCEDRCNTGEVCRASDEQCVTPDPVPNVCGATCMSDQRCIGGQCQMIRPLEAFRDLPRARGLWPSLQNMPDGGVLIAYYDRVDTNLKIARIEGADLENGNLTTTAIDGTGVQGSIDDAGWYPSLFITPGGEIHLAYMNATKQMLVYRNLDENLATLVYEEVDRGLEMGDGPDGVLIGADSALVVDRNGVVRVAYQDATHGDLKYAMRTGGMWDVLTLAGTENPYAGSFGFYTDQTLDQNRERPLVSTYRYFLSGPNGPLNGVQLFSAP
jgi:hypothetical protein